MLTARYWFFILLFLSALALEPVVPQEVPGPYSEPQSTATPLETATPSVTTTPELQPSPVMGEPTPVVINPLPFALPLTRDGTRAAVLGPSTGRRILTLTGAEGYEAKSRAEVVTDRLRLVAEAQGDKAVLVTSKVYDGMVVIEAGDTVLVTVMPEDIGVAEPRALPEEDLRRLEIGVAENWRMTFQRELGYAAWVQRPEYLRFAIPLVLGVLLLAGALQKFMKYLRKRYSWLPIWSLSSLMWTLVAIFVLWMFPQTKSWAWATEETLLWPFIKFYIVFLCSSVITFLLEKIVVTYFDNLIDQPDMRPRRAQRFRTLCSVVRNTIRVAIFVMALAIALSFMPINFGPLLTSAGVIGVAIGLAGQDFLKDIIAGVFILVEDRFGVGDWIEFDTFSGLVESINLRSTRLRTIEGGLITVPNSELKVVTNLSNEWSQVDFRVSIAYGSDLDFALEVLTEEALKLAEDWSDKILERPDIKGVEELGSSAVVLRLFFKTRPLLQWDVRREFNRRMKLRLDKEGINIPFPQTCVWIQNAEPVRRSDLRGDIATLEQSKLLGNDDTP